MIRLLNEKDRSMVLKYLYQEPEYNIFIIGDIEAFGFEEDFMRVYGEFDDLGIIQSIFLRYRQSAIYYAHKNVFNQAYLEIFKRDPFKIISGKHELMDLIKPFLFDYKLQATYFAMADKINFDLKNNLKYDVKVLKSKIDCEKLYDFMKDIEEFSGHIGDKSSYVEGKMKSIKMGSTLFIEDQGQIVSTVATTAETTINAMVVSVATDPDYRNKGMASYLLKVLMKDYIIKKKKSLCLFYDNPAAGKIYQRLGFKQLGLWDMYFKK